MKFLIVLLFFATTSQHALSANNPDQLHRDFNTWLDIQSSDFSITGKGSDFYGIYNISNAGIAIYDSCLENGFPIDQSGKPLSKDPLEIIRFIHSEWVSMINELISGETPFKKLFKNLDQFIFSKGLLIKVGCDESKPSDHPLFGKSMEVDGNDYPIIIYFSSSFENNLRETLIHEFLHLTGEGHAKKSCDSSKDEKMCTHFDFEIVYPCASLAVQGKLPSHFADICSSKTSTLNKIDGFIKLAEFLSWKMENELNPKRVENVYYNWIIYAYEKALELIKDTKMNTDYILSIKTYEDRYSCLSNLENLLDKALLAQETKTCLGL